MVEFEWYKRGFGLKHIMGFEDPKLEEFLNKLTGLVLYSSYNEVYLPKNIIDELRGKIKRVFTRDGEVCAETVRGDVWCASLGEGTEVKYVDIVEEEEMGGIEEEREGIRKSAVRRTERALKRGGACLYGWIDSDNPDGVATYELVICKE